MQFNMQNGYYVVMKTKSSYKKKETEMCKLFKKSFTKNCLREEAALCCAFIQFFTYVNNICGAAFSCAVVNSKNYRVQNNVASYVYHEIVWTNEYMLYKSI